MKLKIEKEKWLMEHIKKMTKKEIKFRDPVVERVVDKFVLRSDVGFKKYGTTLHEERTQKIKGLLKYLNDIAFKFLLELTKSDIISSQICFVLP